MSWFPLVETSGPCADLLENQAAAVLHRSGDGRRISLLYKGKLVYHLDVCLDGSVFAVMFCVLSDVLSFLPLCRQRSDGAGQPRRFIQSDGCGVYPQCAVYDTQSDTAAEIDESGKPAIVCGGRRDPYRWAEL